MAHGVWDKGHFHHDLAEPAGFNDTINAVNKKIAEEVNPACAKAKRKAKDAYLAAQNKIYQLYLSGSNELIPDLYGIIGEFAAPNWNGDGKERNIEKTTKTLNCTIL